MSWLTKLLTGSKVKTNGVKKGVPEGIWTKCDSCGTPLYRAELERNLLVCPKCNTHMRLHGRQRLEQFLDLTGREELAVDIEPQDRLKFKDRKKYKDRITRAQAKTGEKSALLAMSGAVLGLPVVAVAFDFSFIGGSMGSAVGEKFVQAASISLQRKIPFICFSASGGARMQEGLVSLFQMAKTSAVLSKLAQAKIPYISILTDPTTGGVSASLAMLGDIIIAEPNAVIGFAGRRVIEQTVRQQLPAGFQRSEFLLKQGAIDMVVDRSKLRETVAELLAKLTNKLMPSVNE